jgi:O-methyltransferase involved in polyketide biosynthesis
MDDAGFDTTVAHPARRYNYWLGGTYHFAADRESGDEFARRFPGVRTGARANRAMVLRATRHLAAEAGIRQFLDIGSGLPTAENTHQAAQRVAPDSRVVYVDNDPLVTAYADALCDGDPRGRAAYIEADVRDPGAVLAHPVLRDTLDLSRPVALLLVAVLHFVPGDGAAQPIVRRLLDALPAGSHLVATHATMDFSPPEHRAEHRRMRDAGRSDVWTRDRAEFTELFDGLDLVDPGVVPVSEWRPDPGTTPPAPRDVAVWGAVGRRG